MIVIYNSFFEITKNNESNHKKEEYLKYHLLFKKKGFEMKTAKSSLEAANRVVPKIEVNKAIQKHAQGNSVFIDVRDGTEIAETGTIKGALKIPRGFIEFAADPETQFHNKALEKDSEIILVCAAGGMAALTGHTLVEMGYTKVLNVGGFSDWKDANGPVESS